MSVTSTFLMNIERLGDTYCEQLLLKQWDKERLESDWWVALDFFYGHSFMRGRRDKLSNDYWQFTMQVLAEYFAIESQGRVEAYNMLIKAKELLDIECIMQFRHKTGNYGAKGSIIKYDNFYSEIASKNPIISKLTTKKKVIVEWEGHKECKEIHLGNEEDLMMVLDVLRFISDNDKKNIYNYLKWSIERNGANKTGEELKGIRAIGDKISYFIVRDIGLLNNGLIRLEESGFAFPVDTWVRQISKKLGFESSEPEYIIERCRIAGVSPLKVAAGLWYLGFNSLDIALQYMTGEAF